MNYIAFMADGGSRGNPGPAAWGSIVLKFDDLEELKDFEPTVYPSQSYYENHTYQELNEYLGETTNNVAEWNGVLKTLEYIKNYFELGETIIYIYLDSELVCKQIKGEYKVKNPGLKPIWEMSMKTLKQLKDYKIFHIYRKYNKIADSLVNQAIDNKSR